MKEKLFDAEGMTSSERILHTPSGFARNSFNYVQEVGELKSLKSHICARENLESFLFFLVLEGEGTVSTAGQSYSVKAGDGVFLDCRKYYEHQSSETNPWRIRWVHFDGQEVKACYPLFWEGNKQSPVVVLGKELPEYESVLKELMALQNQKNVMGEIESSYLLSGLLVKCLKEVRKDAELTNEEEGTRTGADFETIRETINDSFGTPDLAKELAKQYGVEEEQLNKAFQKKYGISVADYIVNRKFNKAKELLRFTIKPIEEVAADSGLENMEEFRKLFDEQEKMSPEDYRKKWAQWIKG